MLHNLDMEKSVLASLMINENYADVEGKLTGKNFYAERHETIFDAITHLYNQKQPYDVVMVMDELESKNKLHLIGGEEYLGELLASSSATFNIAAYCVKIKDFSQRRSAIEKLKQGIDQLENFDKSTDTLINDSISDLNNVMMQSTKGGYVVASSLLDGFYEKLLSVVKHGVQPFIGTGFEELNNKLQVEKGDLVIIAARPSMGKTTLAQNIAVNMVKETGKTGVFFSLEMTKESVIQRLISATGSVRLGAIRSGDLGVDGDSRFNNTTEWGRMVDAMDEVKNLSYVIDDTNGLTVGEMRSVLNKIRREQGEIGVIMVDYIQIMGGIDESGNTARQIGNITRELKGFGKEFDCPVIALSQLNRSLETRGNKRPIMSDLRESGAIEQDADQILFIYRDEVYNAESKEKGVAEIIIGKNRQGEIGSVRLGFEGQYSRFTNYVPNFDDEPTFGGNHA